MTVRTLMIMVAVAACDRAETTSTKPPAVPPAPTAKVPAPLPPVDAPPALTGCAALDRANCLASKDCTLHRIGNNHYECLAAKGPCEMGLDQDDQKACVARTGCTFVPGNCYCTCPGPVTMRVPDGSQNGLQCGCACGGGPPSMCVERTATK